MWVHSVTNCSIMGTSPPSLLQPHVLPANVSFIVLLWSLNDINAKDPWSMMSVQESFLLFPLKMKMLLVILIYAF